jgi:hypothetical protein
MGKYIHKELTKYNMLKNGRVNADSLAGLATYFLVCIE